MQPKKPFAAVSPAQRAAAIALLTRLKVTLLPTRLRRQSASIECKKRRPLARYADGNCKKCALISQCQTAAETSMTSSAPPRRDSPARYITQSLLQLPVRHENEANLISQSQKSARQAALRNSRAVSVWFPFAFPARQSAPGPGQHTWNLLTSCTASGPSSFAAMERHAIVTRRDCARARMSHRCQSTLSVILVPVCQRAMQGRSNRHLAAGSGQLATIHTD